MKKYFPIGLLLFCLLSCGCAQVTETAKVLWGSSTATLEEAREDGESKTFACSYEDCFDTVLRMDRDRATEDNRLPTNKIFDVFLKDRSQGHMVVMGISGNVNTTKVGIFFERKGIRATQIDITSLSSTAKEKVAAAVFNELSLRYSEKSIGKD